ncbi:MAG: cell division protein FtsQ [Alphaproteobacteria bacterium]|nr:cell division protein FtsQ [Alphaproteobacteria bacterium]
MLKRDIDKAGGRMAAVLQGLFTLCWLAFGVWQGIAALSTEAARNRLAPTFTFDALFAGRTAAAINHVMAHDLPADAALRGTGGALRWRLFASGGPQTRVGCDDWLYLTEELRPWDNAEANMAARAAGLRAVRDALAALGIPLIIAIAPDKARVHPENLCGAPWSAQSQARHDAFLALLARERLPAVDSLGALRAGLAQGPVYLRTDTHWNQRGAALVAQAIADAARGLPVERPGGFTTTEQTPVSHPGDLLRLMNLDHTPDRWRPRPDIFGRARTTAPEPAGGGLLDETPAPQVVLLGSSYSVNGNFHGALQQAMGTRVANFGQAGAGFAGAALRYFASPAWRESPPRVVVWEVLERALGQPLSLEERAFLTAPLR